MKGFKFRLQPVLSIRENRLETVQRQLAASMRLLEAEKVKMRGLEEAKLNQHLGFGRIGGPGELDVAVLEIADNYLERLDEEIEAQSKVIEVRTQTVVVDREAVLEASRDKKAMEKLKANRMLAYARAVAKKEEALAEELATSRFLLGVREQTGELG